MAIPTSRPTITCSSVMTCPTSPSPFAAETLSFMVGTSQRVALDRARHAVPAAAALAELEAGDLDDLDAGLAHLRDRERVALVGDHHTGLERDDVVAVVPLLPLLLVAVAAGLHDVKLRDAERICHRGDEVLVLPHVDRAGLRSGAQADGADALDHLRIGGGLVAVEHGEDRVEVH